MPLLIRVIEGMLLLIRVVGGYVLLIMLIEGMPLLIMVVVELVEGMSYYSRMPVEVCPY